MIINIILNVKNTLKIKIQIFNILLITKPWKRRWVKYFLNLTFCITLATEIMQSIDKIVIVINCFSNAGKDKIANYSKIVSF